MSHHRITFKFDADHVAAFRAAVKDIHASAEAAAQQERDALYQRAEVGDVLPDGSICGGISPDTGKRMYVLPEAFSGSFGKAVEHAAKLNGNKQLGRSDWRMPSKAELAVLFANKDKAALKDVFNDRARELWSSSIEGVCAWWQNFAEGGQYTSKTDLRYSAAYVRSLPA